MSRVPHLSAFKAILCATSLTLGFTALPAFAQNAAPDAQSKPTTETAPAPASSSPAPAGDKAPDAATPAATDKATTPAPTAPANDATKADPAKEAPSASDDQDYIDIAPAEVPREINEFKLSEDLLSRMEKVHDELSKLQLSATEEEGADPNPSIDQMVASIERRPEVVNVIKAHNISARDYILAYFALMSALASADAETEDQMVDEAINVNPDHVAFGKQFSERIRNLIGE